SPGDSLHAGHQRHAFHPGAGVQQGRRLLRLPEGRVRRALRRRCRSAENALDRPALPPDRPPCPPRFASAFP
nr:hypothetical protein [Tanacetum cinerariifolium]